eukprot:2898814-Lingulodinium_polyedra.AAC.1
MLSGGLFLADEADGASTYEYLPPIGLSGYPAEPGSSTERLATRAVSGSRGSVAPGAPNDAMS